MAKGTVSLKDIQPGKWAGNESSLCDLFINHNIDIVKHNCFCSEDLTKVNEIYCLIKSRYRDDLESSDHQGFVYMLILQELFKYGYIEGIRAERARHRAVNRN